MEYIKSLGIVPLMLYLAIATAIYFLPNWVAIARKHHQGNAIFITNLLLGCTGLGWIAALIWSFMAVREEPDKDTKTCPDCAELVKQAAKVCRYCGRDLQV